MVLVGEDHHRRFKALLAMSTVERSKSIYVYAARSSSDRNPVAAKLKWEAHGLPRLSAGPMSCTTRNPMCIYLHCKNLGGETWGLKCRNLEEFI